jgi:hypothetical protein
MKSIYYGYSSLFVGFGTLLVNLPKNHWRHGLLVRQTHGGQPADRPHMVGEIVVATAGKVILGQACLKGVSGGAGRHCTGKDMNLFIHSQNGGLRT